MLGQPRVVLVALLCVAGMATATRVETTFNLLKHHPHTLVFSECGCFGDPASEWTITTCNPDLRCSAFMEVPLSTTFGPETVSVSASMEVLSETRAEGTPDARNTLSLVFYTRDENGVTTPRYELEVSDEKESEGVPAPTGWSSTCPDAVVNNGLRLRYNAFDTDSCSQVVRTGVSSINGSSSLVLSVDRNTGVSLTRQHNSEVDTIAFSDFPTDFPVDEVLNVAVRVGTSSPSSTHTVSISHATAVLVMQDDDIDCDVPEVSSVKAVPVLMVLAHDFRPGLLAAVLSLPAVAGRTQPIAVELGDDACSISAALVDFAKTETHTGTQGLCETVYYTQLPAGAHYEACSQFITTTTRDGAEVYTLHADAKYTDVVEDIFGNPLPPRPGSVDKFLVLVVQQTLQGSTAGSTVDMATLFITSEQQQLAGTGDHLEYDLGTQLTHPQEWNVNWQSIESSTASLYVGPLANSSVSTRECSATTELCHLNTDTSAKTVGMCKVEPTTLSYTAAYALAADASVAGELRYIVTVSSAITAPSECASLERLPLIARLSISAEPVLVTSLSPATQELSVTVVDPESGDSVLSVVRGVTIDLHCNSPANSDPRELYNASTSFQHAALSGVGTDPALDHNLALEISQEMLLEMGANRHNLQVCYVVELDALPLGEARRVLQQHILRARATQATDADRFALSAETKWTWLSGEPIDEDIICAGGCQKKDSSAVVIGVIVGGVAAVAVAAVAVMYFRSRRHGGSAGLSPVGV